MAKTTAQVNEAYHHLSRKEVPFHHLVPFYQWLPRKYINWRIHWNAIWHHRLAMEIACQVSEAGDYHTFQVGLEDYWRGYKQLYSTMPFCSNKSISHYVGQCALDAVLWKKDEKNIITLDKALKTVTKDGAFTEGGHYSKYVTDCFDRVENLFDNWYGEESNSDALKESYQSIKENVAKVKTWQQLISDSDGVMAVIGDGWHEKVEPTDSQGIFKYDDMTINRQGPWLTIQNHRVNGFALHQHPHGNEILIAHENDWLVKGSGMPSYKHVMKKPFKWRRPRNHFFTETKWDWWWIWRHRKSTASDSRASRILKIDDSTNTVVISETNKRIIRWPGERNHVKRDENNSFTWSHGKFSFRVEGINIKLMTSDYAYAATTYRNEQQIPVIRISGENLITRITVNDK